MWNVNIISYNVVLKKIRFVFTALNLSIYYFFAIPVYNISNLISVLHTLAVHVDMYIK